jgi:molecular chaperone DnaK
MAVSKVYGIDLGTTYSVIAQVDANGKARVLQNDVGRPTTPSVVYFPEPGRVVIGEDAKNVLKVSPDETVAYVKRSMGTQLEMDFHGRSFTPESSSALIL